MEITYGKLENGGIIYPKTITYAKEVEIDVEIEKEVKNEGTGEIEKVKAIEKQLKEIEFETSACQLFLNENPTIAKLQGWVDVSTIVLPPSPTLNIPNTPTLEQQADLIDFLLKKTGAIPEIKVTK